jgi:hypothetical protein
MSQQDTFGGTFRRTVEPIVAAFKEAWPLDFAAFEESFPVQIFEDAFKEGLAFYFSPFTVLRRSVAYGVN